MGGLAGEVISIRQDIHVVEERWGPVHFLYATCTCTSTDIIIIVIVVFLFF